MNRTLGLLKAKRVVAADQTLSTKASKETRFRVSRDLAALVSHRGGLPGATDDTAMLVVSRSGSTAHGMHVLGPEELMQGWRRTSPEPGPAAS